MGRVHNAQFLESAADLLSKNEGQSSVYLTQKRLKEVAEVEEPKDKTIDDLPSNVVANNNFAQNHGSYPLLIRLSMNGKDKKKKSDKEKISTVVEAGNLESFWSEYAQVLKNGFVGLKKKEKKKEKKKGKKGSKVAK